MRGRYPESSSRVNKGKNIAIGGSITEVTQARVLYTPAVSISFIEEGKPISSKNDLRGSSSENRKRDNSSDG